MSVTMLYKKLWKVWPIISSQQYINAILKILLVMLTLKSIRIIFACDT